MNWLRSQPDKQELVRHCYYDDPLECAAARFSQSEEWQAVTDLLQNHLPGEVLDVGAGRGISSYAFAKQGCQVTALEPDPSDLVGAQAIQSLAQSTQLPIQTISEFGETLPFQDHCFNIVYGRAVLHHAQDLNSFCRESARVLKRQGAFIATREHVVSKKEDIPIFLEAHPLHSLYGGENAYLLSEYLEAIKGAGLKLEKVIGPFESVINFAPLTQEDFQNQFSVWLSRYLGSKASSHLATVRPLQKMYGWYLSQRLNSPGRHYSFLATKE